MSTGEGADARDERSDRDDRDRRGERIGVGGGDDSVTRIQLAARWAESYGPVGDSLAGVLRRFRAAFEYLDAVTHGVEPPDVDREFAETRPARQPMPAPAYSATSAPGRAPEASPPPPPPPAPGFRP
jgi:hypothetical protein